MFNFIESIQILSETLTAVPMVAIVANKCRGNIGTFFRKLVRGSLWLNEMFKSNLFNLFKSEIWLYKNFLKILRKKQI